MSATATGIYFSTGKAGLELSVATKQLSAFMAEFRASNNLCVTFDGANVSGWFVSLAGTNVVSQVFVRCILSLS
jgi:hypothetical protein